MGGLNFQKTFSPYNITSISGGFKHVSSQKCKFCVCLSYYTNTIFSGGSSMELDGVSAPSKYVSA